MTSTLSCGGGFRTLGGGGGGGEGPSSVPWRYMTEPELRRFLVDEMVPRGFVFPLNPKWLLCRGRGSRGMLLPSPQDHRARTIVGTSRQE